MLGEVQRDRDDADDVLQVDRHVPFVINTDGLNGVHRQREGKYQLRPTRSQPLEKMLSGLAWRLPCQDHRCSFSKSLVLCFQFRVLLLQLSNLLVLPVNSRDELARAR